jgi:hypothetical protein
VNRQESQGPTDNKQFLIVESSAFTPAGAYTDLFSSHGHKVERDGFAAVLSFPRLKAQGIQNGVSMNRIRHTQKESP